MQHLAEALGISEYPLACYNGALVLANRNLSAPPISSHEVAIKEVVRIISETRTHFSQVSINLYSDTVWYVDRLDEWVKRSRNHAGGTAGGRFIGLSTVLANTRS